LTEDVFEEEIEIGNADDEEDDEEDYAIEYEYEEGKTSFGYPLPCSHHITTTFTHIIRPNLRGK